VVLGGEDAQVTISGYDMVICADSGYRRISTQGQRPTHLIGDMDSLDEASLADAAARGIDIIRYPEEKELSDGEAALLLAIEKGSTEVTIMGTLGSRSDHLLSTYLLLSRIPKGTKGELRIGDDRILLVREGETVDIQGECRIISLVPYCEGTVISTLGLRYHLDRETLEYGTTRGIHNEKVGPAASVEVLSGGAFLIISEGV